jgi:hypothetical protein
MIWKNASNISRQDADESLIRLKDNLIFVKMTKIKSVHLQVYVYKWPSALVTISSKCR